MASSFKLPDLGEGLTEGEVARWLVAEGQEIAEDDPLVEIQTDKATVEIPSPYAGTVLKILVAEGESRRSAPSSSSSAQPGESAPASPKRLRRRQRSAQGRVRERAIRRECRRLRSCGRSRRSSASIWRDRPGTGPGGTDHGGRRARRRRRGRSPEGRREPLRGVRRVIAEHMARAHREVPAGDLGRGVRLRGRSARRAPARRSSRRAPTRLPSSPSSTRGSTATRSSISTATTSASPSRRTTASSCRSCAAANEKSGRRARRRDRDARRAAPGRESLAPDELRGSTFTVTSAGKLAGLFQTPIVNHPEVAILSVGRVAPRPVVR